MKRTTFLPGCDALLCCFLVYCCVERCTGQGTTPDPCALPCPDGFKCVRSGSVAKCIAPELGTWAGFVTTTTTTTVPRFCTGVDCVGDAECVMWPRDVPTDERMPTCKYCHLVCAESGETVRNCDCDDQDCPDIPCDSFLEDNTNTLMIAGGIVAGLVLLCIFVLTYSWYNKSKGDNSVNSQIEATYEARVIKVGDKAKYDGYVARQEREAAAKAKKAAVGDRSPRKSGRRIERDIEKACESDHVAAWFHEHHGVNADDVHEGTLENRMTHHKSKIEGDDKNARVQRESVRQAAEASSVQNLAKTNKSPRKISYELGGQRGFALIGQPGHLRMRNGVAELVDANGHATAVHPDSVVNGDTGVFKEKKYGFGKEEDYRYYEQEESKKRSEEKSRNADPKAGAKPARLSKYVPPEGEEASRLGSKSPRKTKGQDESGFGGRKGSKGSTQGDQPSRRGSKSSVAGEQAARKARTSSGARKDSEATGKGEQATAAQRGSRTSTTSGHSPAARKGSKDSATGARKISNN